jgi:hypothetical protein
VTCLIIAPLYYQDIKYSSFPTNTSEKLTSFHIREQSFLLVILFEATTENVHDVAMKLLVRLYYAS